MKFVSWNVNGLRACEGKAAIEREESKAAFDSSEREQARPNVKDCPCIINVAQEYADLQPK